VNKKQAAHYLGDLDGWVHHPPHKNWYLILLILHHKDERTVDNDVEAVVEGGGEEDDLSSGGCSSLGPLLAHLQQRGVADLAHGEGSRAKLSQLCPGLENFLRPKLLKRLDNVKIGANLERGKPEIYFRDVFPKLVKDLVLLV